MAYKVEWSPTALDDIEAIATYISRDSVAYAAAVVKKILDSIRTLRNFPFAGRIVPEFEQSSIREVFAYSYRIVYRGEGNSVIVVAVIHGKRLLGSGFPP